MRTTSLATLLQSSGASAVAPCLCSDRVLRRPQDGRSDARRATPTARGALGAAGGGLPFAKGGLITVWPAWFR